MCECFSLGEHVLSGSHDGKVHVWDITQSFDALADEPCLAPRLTFQAHNDVINGIRHVSHSDSHHFSLWFLWLLQHQYLHLIFQNLSLLSVFILIFPLSIFVFVICLYSDLTSFNICLCYPSLF